MKKKRQIRGQVTKPSIRESLFSNTNLLALVLFVYSFIIYANTLFNKYAQDDAIVITENMFTKQGFKGIPGLLSHDTFYGFFKKSGKDKLVSGGRYRPLSPISFAVEYQFFGLNPLISHLINTILYGLLGMLLFKFLLLLFKNNLNNKYNVGIAFITSLIFVAHPLHTEVVANIKGRDEIFSLFFGILALYFTLKWLNSRNLKFQVFAFCSFLLALFSKENSITLVIVAPLIIWFFYPKKSLSYIYLLLPYVVSAIIFLSVRTAILGFDFGNSSTELMNNPFLKFTGNTWVEFSLSEKFSTIIYTLGKYIILLIFPHPLTNDYYPRQIPVMGPGDWRVLLSFVFYIFIIFLGFRMLRKNKIISFSILFFLITLSIVSNIIFPVGTNMSERFLFMPSVGFSLVAGYLIYSLFEKRRTFTIIAISVIICLFSIKTISRNTVWKDDFTLYTTDVKVSHNSAKALNAAGGSLVDAAFNEKDTTKKKKMLIQAKEYLSKAMKIHPGYENALLINGNADYFLGNYEEAIFSYRQLLKTNPGFEDAKKNFPIILREAGKYFGEQKNDLTRSLDYLSQSYQLDSTNYETIRLIGIANAFSGNLNEALYFFKKGVERNPENAGAYLNLGNVYYNLGDGINGKKYHDIAIKLDPEILKNKR
jgi:protein O-mannosyl-transferase